MKGKAPTNDSEKSIRAHLRDPIWEFAGVIVAILAISVTFCLFFLEHKTKRLQVVILAKTSLVEVEQSITQDVQITFRDQLIADLTLLQVKVENEGNQAILAKDYEQPIKFKFLPQIEIIEAIVLETDPPNIDITMYTEQNIVTLSPVLLNPKDRIIVRFMITSMLSYDDTPLFDVDARIAGVKDITVLDVIEEKWPPEFTSGDVMAYFLGIGVIVIVVVVLMYTRTQLHYSKRTEKELKNVLREVVTELQEEKNSTCSNQS